MILVKDKSNSRVRYMLFEEELLVDLLRAGYQATDKEEYEKDFKRVKEWAMTIEIRFNDGEKSFYVLRRAPDPVKTIELAMEEKCGLEIRIYRFPRVAISGYEGGITLTVPEVKFERILKRIKEMGGI